MIFFFWEEGRDGGGGGGGGLVNTVRKLLPGDIIRGQGHSVKMCATDKLLAELTNV